MRLLLDTNALLWLLGDDDRLAAGARRTIENAQELAISETSLWEIAIKISIGKLKPLPELFDTVRALGFRRLPLSDQYLLAYEQLPLLHRDPFDRLLVAQARVENMALVTSDNFLKAYNVRIVNAT